ncbi:atypical/HisK protein kinase [Coprinopsis sp. MPI-PUGE-AT-0042]|nr:atypical/HisK protein kinase [Coprinopsis sp. MPI-PUGE-AT-0042]
MFADSEHRQPRLPQISMANGDSIMDTSMQLHCSQGPADSGEFRLKNPNTSKRHTVSLPSSPYQEGPSRSSLGGAGDTAAPKDMNMADSFPIEGRHASSTGPEGFNAPSSDSTLVEGPSLNGSAEWDWATFINAYAHGRWDPHKAPNRPRLAHFFPPERPAVQEPPKASTTPPRVDDAEALRMAPPKPVENKPNYTHQKRPSSGGMVAAKGARFHNLKAELPLKLSSSGHRSMNSYPSSSLKLSLGDKGMMPNPGLPNPELHTTVATMRWAAARVDISPLALPSPEHELTDPMRGIVSAVPGHHGMDSFEPSDHITTPGGSRRSRLSSFWQGTIDVDSQNFKIQSLPRKYTRLNPPPQSTSSSQHTSDTSGEIEEGTATKPRPVETSKSQLSVLAAQPPPASAPILEKAARELTEEGPDYFGNYKCPAVSNPAPRPLLANQLPEVQSTVSNPPLPTTDGSLSVPALPRRICLTRQTSSPLPTSLSPPDPRMPCGRVSTESIHTSKAGKSAKEENMYASLGYLAPPNPPEEWERRRALYKFNLWNTGPDPNFDRITHLVKLVFNTKGVIISLIDGNDQWCKSECGSMYSQGGLKSSGYPRTDALCGHAILQQGDDPTIVLDTHLDWRFAQNPLVTGPSRIRFYAGAPLRTQDGYNIGTLAIVDDVPREDFSPRQRHTLKEFAAIAMREMELWRDKIQLRIRDRIQSSMEEFTRECLEIDSPVPPTQGPSKSPPKGGTGSSMDRVYDHAAKLVERTLDVEGVFVMDVSHSDVVETMGSEGNVSVILHSGKPGSDMEKHQLTSKDYKELKDFFKKHPQGKISEGIIPPCFRPYMPTHIRYALIVPIFNVDKRPFALLCAYNSNIHTKRFLEGHELSYLRAIGVIILSAVLKRRMILADKAKSLFISNISHELRTPLHGILAAAELLSESPLNHSQMSFIQTVQACGTSLVETVNHVLDFTKLSGNSKAGGVENVIVRSTNDLSQLIEEAIDGSWIGYRARTAILGDSGIGSVYSPPTDESASYSDSQQWLQPHVETVIDIGYRKEGWLLKFEKGGIRRVLMNLFGNSLKFTTDGYVHVRLRLAPPKVDDPPNYVRVELAIEDTGKGISQNFLKNQLFHPFSQENPLQTGTGLGLAIVNSIVSSENVGGKVDVWSEEGVGTEIRVSFPAETSNDDARIAEAAQEMQSFKLDDPGAILPKVALLGFDSPHKGVQLLRNVLRTHITEWWEFDIVDDPKQGDIFIVNEDIGPIQAAIEARDNSHPFIILWAMRGNPTVLSVATDYERIGGICRILYKPNGPTKLRSTLKLCVHAVKMSKYHDGPPQSAFRRQGLGDDKDSGHGFVLRRNSDETTITSSAHKTMHRPTLPRSVTAHPSLSSLRNQISLSEASRSTVSVVEEEEMVPTSNSASPLPTIPVGPGGSILKSSIQSADVPTGTTRVLVVEDNSILRNLLIKWLIKKGYDYYEAVDGQAGVNAFTAHGPFNVALIDLSMPILDGFECTTQLRALEAKRNESGNKYPSAKILALTGMSSLEDKRKAFEAGFDGYLVKPVAFKTLDEMFQKLGIAHGS